MSLPLSEVFAARGSVLPDSGESLLAFDSRPFGSAFLLAGFCCTTAFATRDVRSTLALPLTFWISSGLPVVFAMIALSAGIFLLVTAESFFALVFFDTGFLLTDFLLTGLLLTGFLLTGFLLAGFLLAGFLLTAFLTVAVFFEAFLAGD